MIEPIAFLSFLYLMPAILASLHALYIKSKKGLLTKILVTYGIASIVISIFSLASSVVENMIFRNCFEDRGFTCDEWLAVIGNNAESYLSYAAYIAALVLSLIYYRAHHAKNI